MTIPRIGTAIKGFVNLPHTDTDTWRLPAGVLNGYARSMALTERQLLGALSRTPFVDSTEMVGIRDSRTTRPTAPWLTHWPTLLSGG